MKMIKMTQNQRNVVYAFGQKEKEVTISHLLQISNIMVNKEMAAELIDLSGKLIRDEVTDEMWKQNFYTIRHRKEMVMNRMVADYQKSTGDYEDGCLWWIFAKQYMIGAFVVEDFVTTMRNMKLVARLTTDPKLKKVAEEAIDDLQDEWDGDVVEYYDKFLPMCRYATQYRFADDNYLYAKIKREGCYDKAD